MKIKEVNKSDVLRLIVEGTKVFRINIKNLSVADLGDKTINVIKRDMAKNDYIYFTLVNVEINHENPFKRTENVSMTIEQKRKYIREFCSDCSKCPLRDISEGDCYTFAPDEIIERNYDLVRNYEKNESEV